MRQRATPLARQPQRAHNRRAASAPHRRRARGARRRGGRGGRPRRARGCVPLPPPGWRSPRAAPLAADVAGARRSGFRPSGRAKQETEGPSERRVLSRTRSSRGASAGATLVAHDASSVASHRAAGVCRAGCGVGHRRGVERGQLPMDACGPEPPTAAAHVPTVSCAQEAGDA